MAKVNDEQYDSSEYIETKDGHFISIYDCSIAGHIHIDPASTYVDQGIIDAYYKYINS